MPELPQSLLVVSSFLEGADLERYPSAALGTRLAVGGWWVTTTSRKVNKVFRLCDMLFTIWRMRRDYEIALVDVFSGPAFFWAETVCWALRRLGKPYVLTLHGGHLPEFAARWPRRVRRLLNYASVVTTPSPYLRERMQHYRPDLRLLPNAIDLARYPFRLRANPQPKLVWLRAFCHIYNPTLAPKVVACLLETSDHMTTDHGPSTTDLPSPISHLPSPISGLLAPCSLVLAPLASLHVTMYGPDTRDGSLARVRAEVGRLKLEDRVVLAGRVDKSDVPRVLSEADIFLNTTNVDNTPVSVLEAMACGLCVVSTNVGGIPYLLSHHHNALLVPPNDAVGMAAAVWRILTEPGLAERLSRNARAKAEQFDWWIILPQWEQLLRGAMKLGRA
jgi:glycosyltransferase involved in cell wall biosynthesis